MHRLVINASEIVTVPDPGRPRAGREMRDLGVIRNGHIIVEGEIIVEVGPGFERGDVVIDARGKTVLPGFVDPHTHLVFAGTREDEMMMRLDGLTYMEILKRGGGILRTVRATREASKEELEEQARRRLDTMLLHGTTTAEAKSGYGLDYETERKMLEVINEIEHPVDLVPTFLGAHALPPGKDADEFIDEMIDVMSRVRHLAKFADIFCERGVFTPDQSRRYLMAAREMGLVPKIHADEIADIGCSMIAVEVGAVSADHMVKTCDQAIRSLAEAGIISVFLPGTPYVLFHTEFPRARKFIEMNAPVAIATDLNPNCFTENMQMIISLSVTRMRMHVDEAITAATLNAAYALGLRDRGSIQEGKLADIIVLNAPNRLHLGYHFGVNLVDTVIKRGRVVVRGQRCVG